MDSRLAEKLRLAGGVVQRQHKKIEDRADAIIAREQVIQKKTDEAFAPHELMLDDAERGLDELQRSLSGLTNDPLRDGNDTKEEASALTTASLNRGEINQ